jgi:hypothetical protein
MSIERKVLGTTPVSGEVLPEGVSFDGTTDYLSRSSDLTGNADGKTFTISAWGYRAEFGGDNIYYNTRFQLYGKVNGQFELYGLNPSGTMILEMIIGGVSDAPLMPLNTWTHILISMDLTNTLNRHVYVNDVLYGGTIGYNSYTNDNIDFTATTHASGNSWDGRLSNLFLDYTYRDLSIESNRRLFITADGKPAADQADLSPILYLPMIDADTAGTNLGTGGDFTQNGVLATADRGPNQDNCSASEFDGVDDNLRRSSTIVTSSTKELTVAFSFSPQNAGAASRLLMARNSNSSQYSNIGFGAANNPDVSMSFRNSSNSNVLDVTLSGFFTYGRTYSIVLSADLTNSSNRYVYVDGVVNAGTWNAYVNDFISLQNYTEWTINANWNGNNPYEGSFGELYLDTNYTDLATNNPFWDSDANRPNSVRKVIEDTGVTPLIAMPIDASNPTKNYGTGGDFTLNGGGLTGARGGSEYWSRSAKIYNGGISDALIRTTALTGASDGKTMTLVCAFKGDVSAGGQVFSLANGSAFLPYLNVTDNTNNRIDIQMRLSSSYVLDCTWNDAAVWSGGWQVVIFSVDMADVNKRHFYVNGDTSNVTWTTYVDANLQLSLAKPTIGNRNKGGAYEEAQNGNVGFLYLSDDYTDFSQESNRNLFINQLGYPRDLQPLIDEGTIPNPLIYMKYDDTAALGTNSGTGGDFLVNGTVTAGADFSI